MEKYTDFLLKNEFILLCYVMRKKMRPVHHKLHLEPQLFMTC